MIVRCESMENSKCVRHKYCRKIRAKFLRSSSARSFRPRSNLFRTGFHLQSKLREVKRILCRLHLRQTVGQHLNRSDLHKSHFWSCAPLFLEERFQLDVSRLASRSLAICCAASVCLSSLLPNCRSQLHCCRRTMPSQAPGSAATNSASPLLSAIVDGFRLDAV